MCATSTSFYNLHGSYNQKADADMEMMNELLFTDNQGLISEDEWQLQKHVTSLNRVSKEHNMCISINKPVMLLVEKKC